MIPRLKSFLIIALSGLLATAAGRNVSAQSSTTVQTFYAIGLKHDQAAPYNFTGRVFDFDIPALASGTLIRRHTVLTAGHVIFDVTAGFSTSLSFARALYGNYQLSTQQVTAENILSGYQAAALVSTTDTTFIAAEQRDLGYLLITDPPVDSNWGNFLEDPTQLINNDGRFILGYPGVTFDGRTMAYIVPTAPYVQVGSSDTALFSNDSYTAEGGFSGGPVYAVVNNEQVVVGELLGAIAADPTGEFNSQVIRAIDLEAAKFLQDGEYNAGLIKRVKITGPKIATRGKTLAYTLTVKFTEPNVDGTQATTNRYGELKLKADATNQAFTTITKISNTQFQVVFSTALRAGAQVTLTGYFDRNMPAPLSTLSVLLQ